VPETNESAPPAPPDTDYVKQVLARYEARHGSFVKQSTIFLVFVFSFLAFVLVPIISLKVESDRVAREIGQKPGQIAAMQEQDTAFRLEAAKLAEERDLVNGELTSLNFVRAGKEAAAERAERQLADLKARLARIAPDKAAQEKRLARLGDSETGMAEALGIFDVGKRVDGLRRWFRETAAGCGQVQDCRDDWQGYYARAVRAKLQADWDADFDFVAREIVDPLRPVEPEIAETIEGRLTEARRIFEANLDRDPTFWRTIDEKEVFMDTLAVEWERAFAGIQAIVGERASQVQGEMAKLEATLARIAEEERIAETTLAAIRREQSDLLEDLEDASTREEAFRERQEEIESEAEAVTERLAGIETDLAALRGRQEEIGRKQTEIEERLSTFQSPFGTLPLGFEEAALAFPFILAAGFLVCALLLANLMRLRREYHALMRSSPALDPRAATDRVALMAPLWLDPAIRSWRNPVVAVLLLLPVPAFLLTAALISSDWLLRLATERSGRILMLFYDALYLAGAVLLGVGVWRVAKEWRRYREALG
jgi:preprotein translocase subunit SecG